MFLVFECIETNIPPSNIYVWVEVYVHRRNRCVRHLFSPQVESELTLTLAKLDETSEEIQKRNAHISELETELDKVSSLYVHCQQKLSETEEELEHAAARINEQIEGARDLVQSFGKVYCLN